jgi:protein-disulfide isomerase
MKPNVIVALLVGLVLGFAVGKVANTPGASSRPDAPTVVAAAPPSSPPSSTEADLPIKSSDFPAETFAGMSDAQKYAAMKVLNDNSCDCGCPNDTFAECAKKDPNCPVAPAKMKQAVELAKSGKSAVEIQQAMFGNSARAAAPRAPAQAGKPSSAPVQKIEIPSDSPMRGSKTAKVTIVEWSDFQCPFCSRGMATVKKIEEAYGKNVRVVFRHQPLPMHGNAKLAAEASMAAHEQGKFWEYHDKLFANQTALERPSLERYAGEVSLDMTRFKAALDSGRFRSKVESDAQAGLAVGASGTPAFFINGRELIGAQPFEKFKEIIDDEINKADKLLASGTKPEELYAKLIEQGAAPRPAPSEPQRPEVTRVEVGTAPVRGPKNAPVTIVEFSDFECPFCKTVLPTLEALQKQYGTKLKVAFKNQPLPFHANARLAAAASLAANAQGKFWEYHDKLFANQQALDRASLDKYAAELGLDMAKFKAALDSKKFDAQITADATEATSAGVDGTPTFFINGRRLVGAQPIEQFKAIIQEELKKSSASLNELKKTAKK